MKTEVLSIRVNKEVKDEADKLGIDVKAALEKLLESMIEAKKRKAKLRARELNRLLPLTVEEWVNGVRKIRQES